MLSFGPIELDTATRRAGARHNEQFTVIELGPREWTVMEYLLLNAPKPASKDKLLQALTGWDKEITPNAVEVYISRLRGKLEPHETLAQGVRGGTKCRRSHLDVGGCEGGARLCQPVAEGLRQRPLRIGEVPEP